MRAYDEGRYGDFLTIVERDLQFESFTDILLSRIENLESVRGKIGERARRIFDKYQFWE